ncbi:MAG: site-2 protease family protein [Candidatus Micrarchaeota archaeon]|nr:site-2 protease family protein [Candidatus Micrarchaeota archaeon]
MPKIKSLKGRPESGIVTVLSLLFSVVALYYLIAVSSLAPLARGVLAIAALLVSSRAIIIYNGLRQLFGAYLLGGKAGVNFVDALSRWRPGFWTAFADWGLVLSFGLASYFLFKKQLSKMMLLFGLLSIFVIVYAVLPSSSIAFQFINLPQITSQINSAAPHQPTLISTVSMYLLNLLLLVGGFSLFILATLVYSALSIIYGILAFSQSVINNAPNYGIISSQVPGVAPILPGITMPLFAGIVTLAIILIVHEFSHGILARVAKVKLKEIGLLVLGVIPIGAYVEPDERAVKRLNKEKQSRILIAGISANLGLSILTFALLVLVATYLLPGFVTTKVFITATAPNSPAFNVIPAGAQVLAWNGHIVTNLTSLAAAASSIPFTGVLVQTDKGNYSLISNATGKIGVSLSQTRGPIATLSGSIVYFIYTVLSLSFLLNFLVGVVNLLPIPSFDGWQIYQLLTKNKKVLGTLAWLAVLSILANVLPWIWAH